jgi:hypothetical protein
LYDSKDKGHYDWHVDCGYEDYTNDEYEDSSEKPEQEFSTGYEDYTLEEN